MVDRDELARARAEYRAAIASAAAFARVIDRVRKMPHMDQVSRDRVVTELQRDRLESFGSVDPDYVAGRAAAARGVPPPTGAMALAGYADELLASIGDR